MIATQKQKIHLRFVVYPLLALFGSIGIFWSGNSAKSVVKNSEQISFEQGQEINKQLIKRLVDAQVSSIKLMEFGISSVKKKNLELGRTFLLAATEKDDNLRDAALYSGFTALAFAENSWTTNPNRAEDYTKEAVRFLEHAKSIDPIHSYTYELLAVAYDNLGKGKLAEEARNKAQSLAQNDENSTDI